MKLAVVQFNPKIGDFAGNGERMLAFVDQARSAGADLVVFPELATTGYPPGDLLDYQPFIDDNLKLLDRLALASQGIGVVCGYVERNPQIFGRPYYNAAAVFENGKKIANYRKRLLPYYDVFDEPRYFEPGREPTSFIFRGKTIALSICEDLWNRPGFVARPYEDQPLKDIRDAKPDLVINLSASPFSLGKPEKREILFLTVAKELGAELVMAGQVGGNDDLLFDGGSLIVGHNKAVCRAPVFKECLFLCDTAISAKSPASEAEWLRLALETGLREYVHKCGASQVCLGLSGGVDSRVVAALAASALGPDKV